MSSWLGPFYRGLAFVFLAWRLGEVLIGGVGVMVSPNDIIGLGGEVGVWGVIRLLLDFGFLLLVIGRWDTPWVLPVTGGWVAVSLVAQEGRWCSSLTTFGQALPALVLVLLWSYLLVRLFRHVGMRGRILLVCLLTSALPLGFLTVAMFRQADQLITDHFQPIGESRIAGEALAVCRDITIEKEIDRMKTDFVSQVSHELRTPLTSIQVCTEMLLDGEVESAGEQKDYLRIIFDESERLTRLINDLLDIARTESGRRVIKPVPLDLASLACNVAAVLAGMAESRRYGKGSTFTVRFRAVAPA